MWDDVLIVEVSLALPGSVFVLILDLESRFGEHLSSPAAWVINPSGQTAGSWELCCWLAHHTVTSDLGWK